MKDAQILLYNRPFDHRKVALVQLLVARYPIEPKWLHGKRAICEADRELTSAELMSRVCEHYGCERLPPIEQKTS